MTAKNALIVFDPENGTFFPFTKAHGVELENIGYGALFCSSGGEIFFGGEGGFQAVSQPMLAQLLVGKAPRIIITGFKLRNEVPGAGKNTILNQSPWVAREIRLNHRQNSFSFSLACLDFRNPDGNYLEYQLQPYDPTWRNDLLNGDASYVNVPPGQYSFYVRGADSFGVWNTGGVRIHIIILPPWWQRWWAYALYGLLLSAAFYTLYRYQLSRRLQLAEASRLRDLDAFKTRFYTNITHEFRTPLTVILGLAGQALDNSRRKREEAVHLIRRNGQHLLRLVNQMLDLSKAESGTLKARIVQGDIVRFLKYSLESYHSWAEGRQIELHFSSEAESLAMDFDPEKVQDIFANLLSNALKATPAGGRITVRVAADDQFLSCAVEDTGHGIEEEQLPYVFDRFFSRLPARSSPPEGGGLGIGGRSEVQPEPSYPPRGDGGGLFSSGGPGGAGTGIGLALTKELLHLLGGRIEVWSAPGQGSRFTFYLPIRREADSPSRSPADSSGLAAAAEPFPSPSGRAGEGLTSPPPLEGLGGRLLIIEDNPDVVYYLRSCLRGRYHIQVAADGQEGVEMALREVPDIIISDVMMPRRDGLEACRILKADERTSHIPIILLTARAAIEDKIQGIRRGADAYLSKPFHREELDAQLEQLLLQRRRLQEHFSRPDAPPPGEAERPEAAFLQKVRACILEYLEEENFGVEELADALFLSRTQLFRKVKALTGRNVAAFIHQVRIGQVKQLLATSDLTVSEIAFRTGFSDPSYLRKVFLKETGETLAVFRSRFRDPSPPAG
ncbi:MAG: response regulator [Phaeodactylibacter sp.]|nr:response regulator [Phaeodactylibacter sp.]